LTADSTEVQKPDASDVAFQIQATLNNTGQTNLTKSVTLVMDGETSSAFTADKQTVTVPADGTNTITLAVQPGVLTSEQYSYRLVVDNETAPLASGNVTFDQPTFAVTDHRTEPVVQGETATVEVDVHNNGDFRGMQTVRLLLDRNHDGTFDTDETVATKAPLIRSEGNASLTLTVETSGFAGDLRVPNRRDGEHHGRNADCRTACDVPPQRDHDVDEPHPRRTVQRHGHAGERWRRRGHRDGAPHRPHLRDGVEPNGDALQRRVEDTRVHRRDGEPHARELLARAHDGERLPERDATNP